MFLTHKLSAFPYSLKYWMPYRLFSKRSLSTHVLLTFAFLLVTIGLSTLWINYNLVHKNLADQVLERAKFIGQGTEFALESLTELTNVRQLSILQRIVQNYAAFPEVIEIFILDPTGFVIASSSLNHQQQFDSHHPELVAFTEEVAISGVEVPHFTTIHGKEALVSLLPFRSALSDLSERYSLIITVIDLKEVTQEAWQTFFTSTLTMLGGSLLILLIMSFVVHKNILSPLSRLHKAISDSEETGEFTRPTAIPDNEIGLLAKIVDKSFKQRQQQMKLEHARHLAEAANQAKSTFLANMSHELRTPLNGILGYTQILSRDRTLTNKQQEGINIIQRSGEYLLTLINDILDLAKIEAGKIELYPVDFKFVEFIQDIVDLLKMRAKQKEINFFYEPTSYLPHRVHADDKRLRQILINLLGNAVKFTEQGEVTLKIGQQENKIHFQIQDTGAGIALEDLGKIYEPFRQVGDNTRKAEGTGLGLPITKQLIELMGGELQVKSTPGQGSLFQFAINLSEVESPVEKMEKQPTIVGFWGETQTILIIDDKTDDRTMLIQLLEPIGFTIKEAIDGQQGIEQAREQKPHCILTDLIMPNLDGLEVTRQLRNIPATANIPIIAMSASVFEYYQKQSIIVGCNAFIAKPIQFAKLFTLLQKYLNLQWKYDDSIKATTTEALIDMPFIRPPKEQSVMLLDLALMGDIGGIIEELKELEEIDRKYLPFINKARQFAKNFDEEKLCDFFQQYI